MKLRYVLLCLFLFLALAPLLLFRSWPHSEVLQNELDEVHERHLLLARNLAAALERYHRDLVTTFDLLLAAPNLQGNPTAVTTVLDNLSMRHLCVADWETGQVSLKLAPIGAPCPDVIPMQTLTYFKAFALPDSVAFGPVTQSPSGENVLHMVKRDGDRLAVAAISTDYFRELGTAIAFGVRGHAAIVDHTGRALSHPLKTWVAERKDMSQISAVQRMMNGETGVETFYSPALKGEMIAGFTTVEPVGWGVMIPQPLQELHQVAANARRSGVVVLLIGLGAALGLSLFVSFKIVRPLEEISAASAKIAGGELALPEWSGTTRFWTKEFRELHDRFRDMVLRLRENIATINVLAYTDSLTRLGNRSALNRQLDEDLAKDVHGALLLIDLDGFKSVNDVQGHDTGDHVLSVVGSRLMELFAHSHHTETAPQAGAAFVARLGGDEFAIWRAGACGETAHQMAQAVVDAMSKSIYYDGHAIDIGASVGIACSPTDGSTRNAIVKAADIAMYDAKKSGKNQSAVYSPALLEAMLAKRTLGHEIEAGLSAGQFVPYFQPQFALEDLSITGVEALVRWHHPKRGLLLPGAFLSTAHELDMMAELDRQVLSDATRLMKGLHAQTGKAISLAVNVSVEQLTSTAFLDELKRLRDLPFELRFELIETMVLDKIDEQLAWTLDQVRESGFKLDLDDFGAAKASVLGLMNVNPSHVKIDRNLVSGIEPGNVPERLVQSIVEMSHSLGMRVVAEGAETVDCVEQLAKMKCDYVQGFVLAKPMSFSALKPFLNDYRPIETRTHRRQA